MKVIIQIPAYEEEETLGVTLRGLPRELPGIESVEWLVIDDGSRDRTGETARLYGADHLVSFPCHLGLAAAFSAGLRASLDLGADIVVNTDADNQYESQDIAALIKPIVEGQADLVVGARPIETTAEFSKTKKSLQKWGSRIVQWVGRTNTPDVTSGFRALSRTAAARTKVFGAYTYTIETLIHAGRSGLRVVSVPIRTNRVERPSRLIKSVPGYVFKSAISILRNSLRYNPICFFGLLTGCTFVLGSLTGLLTFFFGSAAGRFSVALGVSAPWIGFSFLFLLAGCLADLLALNRKLLEDIDFELFQLRHPSKGVENLATLKERRISMVTFSDSRRADKEPGEAIGHLLPQKSFSHSTSSRLGHPFPQ